MKILVLGGIDFIRTHILDELLAGGHDVGVFDRSLEIWRKPLPLVNYCFGNFPTLQCWLKRCREWLL